MAILLSAQNLEKSFGSYQLFRSLSFGIDTGDRIGLIGPNGAGKSTLLKILAERVEADDGKVVRSRGLIVGYLEQSPEFPPDVTIFDAVAASVGDDVERYMDVEEWLGKMHLIEDGRTADTKVTDLSGGWKKRVALARELVLRPDLLVLDEPTNHLDLESILWLEKLIESAKFATMIVTHDRMFLQRTSNVIFDLDRRNPDGLFIVRGSYADYLDAKDSLMAAQERREVVVKNTLRRETEWLRRGAKARTTKQQARIDRHGQITDEAGDLRSRNTTKTAAIDFQSADRHPQKLIEAKGISKIYDGRALFEPIDMIISPKTRLGLLGANGTGKTTLIRMLLGEEAPSTGTVKLAERLQAAYFAQHRDELDPAKSVLKTLCPEGDYVDHRGQYVFARSYLDRFLFRPEQMDMPVAKLSGGEKSRLRLAQLMLRPANVLVLDEPTNDLDMATLAVLEANLRDFDGAVILVTHDRYFLDQVANEILAIVPVDEDATGGAAARLERFADTLQLEAWLEGGAKKPAAGKTAGGAAPTGTKNSAPNSTPSSGTSAPPSVPAAKPKKRLSFHEKRELEGMEPTIMAAESRLAELQTESSRTENLANAAKLAALGREISELQVRIEHLYARWSELGGD